LTGFYYDVNGETVCEACKYTIESRMTEGSSAGHFAKATGAGVVAAALGAALYYAISAVSGYEFGLIAIVVGYAVGTAVRWGSDGRGGKRYQALAMTLTYLAIVVGYIPPIIEGLREGADEDSAVVETTPTDAAAPPAAEVSAPAATPPPPSVEPTTATVSGMMVAGLFILVIACMAPFLGGFQNIIGIVIIGIGLYEAWKLNRRSALAISGPHVLSRPPAEPTRA
jgi:hypothetical protein